MTFAVWIQAIRPKTLVSSFFPTIIGLILAYKHGFFSGDIAAATIACSISLQILTNLANDYFDFIKGADTHDRIGPPRVTASGLVSLSQIKQAILLNVFICLLLGVYLVLKGGFPILLIGVLSVLFAIMYTAGPFPLAYMGLGDVFAFVFFGPVAALGSYYLQTQEWSISCFWAGTLFGFLATALLNANNLRDYVQDKKVLKKTLVVRFGENFGRGLYSTCIILSLVLIPAFCFFHVLPWLSLVTLLSVIQIQSPLRDIWIKKEQNLIPLLAQTAKFKLIYGLLLCLSVLIS